MNTPWRAIPSSKRIERAVYPWLGPGKTADDIEKARAALEGAYHQNGYLSVTVVLPVQKVADNTIFRLQVVEGEVEKLKVSGNQARARSCAKNCRNWHRATFRTFRPCRINLRRPAVRQTAA